MPEKPKTHDEYFAAFTVEQRSSLNKLRKMIHAAVPGAEEYISYGLAAFRLNGKPLVALGATANHCAFYLMSGSIVETHAEDLAGYDTSKGTIRFAANKPLPAALVKKLVKARIAENDPLKVQPKKTSKFDPAVEAFLAELEHPHKPVIETLRKLILGVDPTIQEGIKWNSPSFRTTEYFATLNLRQDRVWLILHTGAKVKANAMSGIPIADPTGLLEWLAKDRAVVKFADANDLKSKKAALEAILREWVKII